MARKILIVDDAQTDRSNLEKIVSEAGHMTLEMAPVSGMLERDHSLDIKRTLARELLEVFFGINSGGVLR